MAWLKFDMMPEYADRWEKLALPCSFDPLDIHCCGLEHDTVDLVCEVIQYGMTWDKHMYFLSCPVCKRQYETECEMNFSGDD